MASARFRSLISDTKNELSDLSIALISDAKRTALEAHDEERNRKLGEERVGTLQNTLATLRRRKTQMEQETRSLSHTDEEIASRLDLLQADVNVARMESDKLKQATKNLIKEVAALELEKEKKVEKLKARFEAYSETWKMYKNSLDMGIELEGPDIFKIRFPKNGPSTLTLRSTDTERWEIIHLEGDPKLKDDLKNYLIQTEDVAGVICRARKAVNAI